MPASSVELAQKEQDEIHAYSRMTFQLFIGWFTFWVTTNLAALGWIALQVTKGEISGWAPVLVLSAFFVFQNSLAVNVIGAIRRTYLAWEERLNELAELVVTSDMAAATRPRAYSIVLRLFLQVFKLVDITMKSLITTWVLMFVAVVTAVLMKRGAFHS